MSLAAAREIAFDNGALGGARTPSRGGSLALDGPLLGQE